MSYAESLDRLESYWNSGTFDASTNPGGLANGGHRQVTVGTTRNFDVVMADIAEVAAMGGSLVNAGVAALGMFLSFTWDEDTADSDQGTGKVWIDNAAAGSAGTLFLSDNDAGGIDRSGLYPRFGASTSSVKGIVGLVKVGDTSKYIYADVTATADASGYYKLSITDLDVSGATPFAAGDTIALGFLRNGDKGDQGDVVGPVSSTDTAIATWNGVGGDTLRNTAWLVNASTGAMTAGGDLDMAGHDLTVDMVHSAQTGQYRPTFLGDVSGEVVIGSTTAPVIHCNIVGDTTFLVDGGLPDPAGVTGYVPGPILIRGTMGGSGGYNVVVRSRNQLTYSDDIQSTAEAGETRPTTDTNTSLSLNAATGPDGLMTLTKLIEDDTAPGSAHNRRQTLTGLSPNQTITACRIIKDAGDGRNYRIQIADADAQSNGCRIDVNPATGVITAGPANFGNGAGATGSVTALADGSYLFTLTGHPNTSGSNTLLLEYLMSGTNITYDGDGTSGVYVGRGVVVKGSSGGLGFVGASRDAVWQGEPLDTTELSAGEVFALAVIPEADRIVIQDNTQEEV